MCKTPYFSLILPIYNMESYLDRCIKSIQRQDFDDYEIILVDDGSTDNCPALCDRYAEEFGYRVIHKQNGGLSSARNAGIEIAQGEYVFWIDSDDWIEENCLKALFETTATEKPDIVKFNHIRMPYGDEVCARIAPGLYEKKQICDELIPLALAKTGIMNFSAWSHIYKREFILKNSLKFVSEREIGSEDYLFNLQAYIDADTISSMSECLYNYDLRDGSLTQRYRKNLIEQYHNLHSKFKEMLLQKGVFETYKTSYAYSYISKALVVCIQNECKNSSDHSLFEGWKNTRKLLKNKDFQSAISLYETQNISKKLRFKLFCMKHAIAFPLMLMMLKGLKRHR